MSEYCVSCEFADGKTLNVRAFNFSTAATIASFYRLRFMGGESHRTLAVVSGKKIENDPSAITMEHCLRDDVAT